MIPLKETTIDRELRSAVERFSKREALRYQGHTWTYEELNEEVDRCARHLIGGGIKKGTHVGLLGESVPFTLFSMLALNRIGALAVMLNHSLSEEELEQVVEDADVEYLPKEETLFSWPEADPSAVDHLAKEVRPEDAAYMLFTSGTTSTPKGVLSSQYSRANSGLQQGADLGMTEADRTLVAMPMFHCFCISVNIMATLFYGGCLVLPESRHTIDVVAALEQERITVFSCVPALYRAILKKGHLTSHNLCLRTGFIGGSSYAPELFEEIDRTFSMTLLSSLGQTEATAGITTANLDDPLAVRATTIGHAMSHVELSIRTDGKEVPEGQVGEICIKGYLLMMGYYKKPEATAKAIDEDGWLHTGDLGFVKQGYVTLQGRTKDIIIRGGENISAKEVESVIEPNPNVWECKAIGVPDEHWGEEVALCIVLKEGETLTEEDVRELFREKVAHYKMPKYIYFLPELPRSTAGKVRIGALKDLVMEKLKETRKDL